AQGVDREQYDAGADRLGGAGVDQDRGQDRSDARRPAGRERHAHQHRSQNAERLRGELLLALAGERGNGEYAGEEDSEQDDEHASDPPYRVLVLAQELTRDGGRGPERDEDQRE